MTSYWWQEKTLFSIFYFNEILYNVVLILTFTLSVVSFFIAKYPPPSSCFSVNLTHNTMNLELLDPFGRQIPDRVDATLDCPHHDPPGSSARVTTLPSAAYHVAWNRRGTYLATGYANGATAVHSLLSRSLVALYPAGDAAKAAAGTGGGSNTTTSNTNTTSQSRNTKGNKNSLHPGVTAVSWARRSRTLLTGAAGDSVVRLLDLTHPYGPEGASLATQTKTDDDGGGGGSGGGNKDADGDDGEETKSTPTRTTDKTSLRIDGKVIAPTHPLAQTKDTAFVDTDDPDLQLVTEPHVCEVRWVTTAAVISKKNRRVSTKVLKASNALTSPSSSNVKRKGKRFPAIEWSFGEDALVGGSLQIHPTIEHAGLATMQDGRLVVFYVSPDAWYSPLEDGKSRENDNGDNTDNMQVDEPEKVEKVDNPKPYKVHVLTLTTSESYSVACASITPSGEEILAVTKDGYILGWKGLDEMSFWKALTESAPAIVTTPSVVAPVPSKPTLWQLLIARNGKQFVVNAADGVLRLYKTADFWEKGGNHSTTGSHHVEAASQLQDVVNRVRFSSCDFSGDGEYLVGGVNGNDNRYELYIWSTATGMLVDTLRGVAIQLYAVAWHPNRALLAAATSDGLVDIWGPRINWTAFAPDFQALPRNVEYVEREDEFDQTKNGEYVAPNHSDDASALGAGGAFSKLLDVRTIETVPAFASDSEDETEVFSFEPRVNTTGRGRLKTHDKTDD